MCEESNLTGWGMCVWYKLFKLLCLWLIELVPPPLCSLSRLYQAGNLISLAVGDNGNIHNSIKLSNDHRQQLGVNIIDLINTDTFYWPQSKTCVHFKLWWEIFKLYLFAKFCKKFLQSQQRGRCWLTIELFCQYIVKRLQICSNIKGSTLHTSFLTRLIRSTNFLPSTEALRTSSKYNIWIFRG